MSEFVGSTNPILTIAEDTLGEYPYEKETHPTFGTTWYNRGGTFFVPGDNNEYMLQESSKRKGIRNKRYIPFRIVAGIATNEQAGSFVEEFLYIPSTNHLSVTSSLSFDDETERDYLERQWNVRRELFRPDSEPATENRERFMSLIRLIGDKGIKMAS